MKDTRTLWGPVLVAFGIVGTFASCSGGSSSSGQPPEVHHAGAGRIADAGAAPDVVDDAQEDASGPAAEDVVTPMTPPGPFSLGGTVTGLVGTGLTLQDNSGEQSVTVAAGAITFAFPSQVASGSSYDVTVTGEPVSPSQSCIVTTGTDTGTVAYGDVSSIAVVCATRSFQVGGTISGLLGSGMVLQDNGGDDLTIDADGMFTFARPVLSGAPFAVTIGTQPGSPSQTCTVSGGNGTVGAAAVTGVVVNCSTGAFAVGGTVQGLTGGGLILRGPGGTVEVESNGNFAFPPVAAGTGYSVTVAAQPGNPAQQCTVMNGTGSVSRSDVTNVTVTCVDSTPPGGCDNSTPDGAPCTNSSPCYAASSTCQQGVCTNHPPSGIVSWWPAEGNVNDVVGTNNGMNNGATFATGKVGQAFSFTGGSYLEIPSASAFSASQFTLEFWVNEADPGSGSFPRIVSWNNDLQSPVDIGDYWHAGTVGVYTQDTWWENSGVQIGSAGWVHVAVTRDSSTMQVYGNGMLAATYMTSLQMESGPLYIGRRYNQNNEWFDGLVDEMTFYSRVLSAAEIQGIYDAGSAGKCR